MRPRAEPTRLTLAAQFEDITESDAGWTFSMWAQFYNLVNDRGWLFFNGSFAKTIRERVSKNRVKVHDGHNWMQNATNTIGRVLSAEEKPRGCRYVGFLTRSQEATAEKLSDGTMDENSVEVTITKAEKIERPLDQVPERIRPFVEITTEGLAVLTGIREVLWWDVGLVSKSSQDRPALIDAPVAVSFQDLPVSLSRWDPEGARERVADWATGGDIARLSRAHVLQLPGGECFGQIADVVDGDLVVVAGALDDAVKRVAEGLSGVLADSEIAIAMAAAGRHLGRYDEKKSLTLISHDDTSVETGANLAPTAQSGGGEPPSDTPQVEPSGTCTHSDEGSTGERIRILLQRARLQRLRHGALRSENEPAGDGRRPSTGRRTKRGRASTGH